MDERMAAVLQAAIDALSSGSRASMKDAIYSCGTLTPNGQDHPLARYVGSVERFLETKGVLLHTWDRTHTTEESIEFLEKLLQDHPGVNAR